MERRRLKVERSLGRLCDECIDDLHRHEPTAEATHGPRKTVLKILRHRDVASLLAKGSSVSILTPLSLGVRVRGRMSN